MRRPIRLAALLLTVSLELSAKTLVINVATNGNDAWTGGFARPTRDDGPMASLPAAIQKARETRKNATNIDVVTILLRGGTYELAEPLVLVPSDSGQDRHHPFLLSAFPGEKPVISGGRRITGWKRAAARPGLWQADVPEVREGKWYFRQLFVDGQRQQRARTPNEGFFRIQGPSPQDRPAQIKFKPGEIKPEWAAAGDVELIALLAWADLRMPIRAVDTNTSVATLAGNPRPSNRENDAQYFIENAPDALDQPGEWYLDRKTGIVSFWSPADRDPNESEIIAPRLSELLVLKGDPEKPDPIQNIVLRGLTFSDTDWDLPPDGYADTQAAIAVPGDIRAVAAVDCVVTDCVFTRLAGYALELGRGCQRWRIVGNEMFDLGGGGIRVGETIARKEAADQCAQHIITDNHLWNLGVIYPPAVGIFVLQSGNNRIAYNEIHDLYYTAISLGWNWGYQTTPCSNNIVEFNHLYDIGKGVLSDMGAIYTLGPQPGTVIRNNHIHDVNAFTYGGWGLYTDEGSTGILLENNVVYRCKSAGFHQHYGRDNILRNNIFAFNKENQLMRTRDEDHISFIFTDNIVYFDSGNLLGSSWKNDKFRLDRNIYYDARAEARPETMRFSGATLDQWRQRGHDQNSIIADPLFANASQFNFRLNPGSPALAMGFKPIDTARAGVRKRDQRTDALSP